MEILFRAKAEHDGQWVEGDLIHYNRPRCEKVTIKESSGLESDVAEDTIGQYIGIKDKNGKRIFDGDIIAIGLEYPKLVAFKDNRAAFCTANIQDLKREWLYPWGVPADDWWRDFGKKFEVVGNKYDNPEMLEPQWWKEQKCKKSYSNLAQLVLSAGVRYWEDGKLNGVRDENEHPKMPCAIPDGKDGYIWKPVIDIKTGEVKNWELGITADIHYKVCDECGISVLDNDGHCVKEYCGYVPEILCCGCENDGDYIIMHIDAFGKIDGWKHDDYLLHEIMKHEG